MRILILYIFPRIMSYAFANMVTSVPSYVFLEAALSLLGLGDPIMPTWGKIISDAYSAGALYYGFWWWILVPSGLALMTAASFALLAYAFYKILNPKLREE
ncbi:MAG: ABC transporter permease, partial [Candidatus Bathyarchaeia archaeon]